MAIITISRKLAALGDETVKEAAKSLNYRIVDKRVLEERIKAFGFAPHKLEKYDERRPSFFASLSQDRDDYLHYLRTAMLIEAVEGNCIFIGRGANIVFRNTPGMISVYLVSPDDIRLNRVKSYFHCDDKRAKQIISQSDYDRKGFHRYFYDSDWTDPGNYHLTINTGYLHPAFCAELINSAVNRLGTSETEGLGKIRIQEMTLAEQIIHHIIYEKSIAVHFLEAAVSGATVILYGVANSQALAEAAITAARELPQVTQVQSEIQIVQEYNVMP
ncbi:MAG: cytidylate kinase-like family protein [Spirochaetaceae bacterium]|jgi:cytidylate kinase|nr:cytidylate kinase-like family protein [Spirochaetaceae bacterium]